MIQDFGIRCFCIEPRFDRGGRCLVFYELSLFSSRSAPDECDGGGCVADGYTRIVAASPGGAGGREDRLLQTTLRRVGAGGFRGHGGQTQPDHLRARRATAMDRVPHMGTSWHQRRGRSRLLPRHSPHTRRRYVSIHYIHYIKTQFYCIINKNIYNLNIKVIVKTILLRESFLTFFLILLFHYIKLSY